MSQSESQSNLTYAILDAALIFGELDTAQKLQTNFLSLYMGRSEELLSTVAPYLFPYESNSEFGTWLLDKGWGNSWGIFVSTRSSMEDLQEHFRKFQMVQTEDGKELYFRFYDPQVLRVFLPDCETHQLKEFFGPVKYYGMEDDDPEYALFFSFDGIKLRIQRIAKSDFDNFLEKSDTVFDRAAISEEQSSEHPKEYQSPYRGWSFLVD